MDSRKKACPNEECKTYKRQKYDAKINFCPECGTKLIYVCKSHKCFKPLDITVSNHDYCFECEAKREDAKDKAIDMAKKAGATVSGVLIVPVAKAAKGDIGKMAQNAVHHAMNGMANAVKNKM